MKNTSAVGSGITEVPAKVKPAKGHDGPKSTVYGQMEGEGFHNGVPTAKGRKAEVAKPGSSALSRGNRD